jgi:hypothetical protein
MAAVWRAVPTAGALFFLLVCCSNCARGAYVVQTDNLRLRAPQVLRGDYAAAVGDVRPRGGSGGAMPRSAEFRACFCARPLAPPPRRCARAQFGVPLFGGSILGEIVISDDPKQARYGAAAACALRRSLRATCTPAQGCAPLANVTRARGAGVATMLLLDRGGAAVLGSILPPSRVHLSDAAWRLRTTCRLLLRAENLQRAACWRGRCAHRGQP